MTITTTFFCKSLYRLPTARHTLFKSIMKLHSDLSPSSVRGNCGGDLWVFFTSLSPHDWHVPPAATAPGMWQGGGNGAFDTFTLSTGDKIVLNLNLVSELPGLLHVFGNITVTPTGGSPIGPL